MSAPLRTARRAFDGVVCIGGGDWWYHNHGHYDIQMVRRLARHVPVLYVNSVGVRVPSLAEGSVFFRRVARKLRSWARGLRRISPDFAVLSPVAVPGRLGMSLSQRLLGLQTSWALKRLGIRRPLMWVECPPGAVLLDRLEPAAVVYQRTDRWEEFPGADREELERYDARLKARADVTLFCSRFLFERERGDCAAARFLDHGVDFERFAAAGDARGPEPEDLAAVPRPRAGFVGGVDGHTFDRQLFVDVARRLSAVQFVVVGSSTLPDGWCPLPNVHFFGQRPYESVADYMAACDVLLMPWRQNEWIEGCNPVKLKEYLAVGRPVVSTPFPELEAYRGLVQVARGPEAFGRAVSEALDGDPGGDPGGAAGAEARRRRVAGETWDSKLERLLTWLDESGVCPSAGKLKD